MNPRSVELFDGAHHFRNVLGGLHHPLGPLQAQRGGVFQERLRCIWRCTRPAILPSAAALRMILSSTSVMFMTWSIW